MEEKEVLIPSTVDSGEVYRKEERECSWTKVWNLVRFFIY